MAARDYHLLLQEEAAFGTYLATGIAAIPVLNAQVDVGQQMIPHRATGAGRALRYNWTGNIEPSMSFNGAWWEEYMGRVLRLMQFVNTSAQILTTTAYEHGWLPSDTIAQIGFSMEVQHTGSAANFLRGGIGSSLTLDIEAGNVIEMSAEVMALDFVRASGTWSDGTAAPAVTASPTYFASTTPAFIAHQVVVGLGGTVAVDAGNYLTVSGGAAWAVPMSISLDINNNVEYVHTLNNQVNPSNLHIGTRDVTLSINIDWDTVDNTFLDAWLANTAQVIEITATGTDIDGGNLATLNIVIPNAILTSGNYPDATGDFSHPEQPLEFTATEDSNGYDISFYTIDSQTDY